MCAGDCLGHGESRIDHDTGQLQMFIVCSGCGAELVNMGEEPYKPSPAMLDASPTMQQEAFNKQPSGS